MSSYSEILDNLHEIKPSEPYSGFNPLSNKDPKIVNYKMIVWFMSAITASCFIFVLYSMFSGFNQDQSVAETISVSNNSEGGLDGVALINLTEEINIAKNEIDQLLFNPIVLNELESSKQKSIETNNAALSVKADSPLNEQLSVKERTNKIITIEESQPKLSISESKNNIGDDASFIHMSASVENSDFIQKSPSLYTLDQLLSMVKDKQFDKALEYSTSLNKNSQLIIQAKIYEQTDTAKAIESYQQLILNPNSPIEYVLKLAILNEKLGNNNQALYFYDLFNRHNTSSNQNVTLFVNKKISSLKSRRKND